MVGGFEGVSMGQKLSVGQLKMQ